MVYGSPAQCNPNGLQPCCSPAGWCGKTPHHCKCSGCIDYRLQIYEKGKISEKNYILSTIFFLAHYEKRLTK